MTTGDCNIAIVDIDGCKMQFTSLLSVSRPSRVDRFSSTWQLLGVTAPTDSSYAL